MNPEIESMILVVVPLLLELVGLMFIVWNDAYINITRKRIMQVIIILVFTMIVQEFLEGVIVSLDMSRMFRIAVAVYGYCVRPVVLLMFFVLMYPKRKFIVGIVLAGINALIYASAFFTDICFTITPNGHFSRGPLGFTCHIISGILLAILYISSIASKEFQYARKSGQWIPVINILLIVAATIIDLGVDYNISFLVIATVNACVFYYIWLHFLFVREHEEMLQAQQRMSIMISQIRPHFMYNTLTTIQSLCLTDPEKAFDITGKFGTYLRQNINSLENSELVNIEKELEHTKVYADIEMVRFPNVRVEYYIEDNDFLLPALTIQPMVENAIRHGVRIRDEGIVTVRTRKKDNIHEIVVSDNGKGFDKKALQSGSGDHIGLNNVKERVERMCGGRVLIKSQIDKGTTIIIRIPDNADEHRKGIMEISGEESK